jgi:predicted secreted protein
MSPQSDFAARIRGALLLASLCVVAHGAAAQLAPPPSMAASPSAVTVSASATASVPNDRMQAWLRAESDNADASAAASVVNARMGKALARARATKGVDASTTGYSSYQITEKNQPSRWRVAQTLKLEGSDFAALSGLVSQLQADGGLVVDGTQFSVSDAARAKAEEALTQQAIKAWQARATEAARGFGFDGWRLGKVAIQTGDAIRPQPRMRAMAVASSVAPVELEAGNTDVTVTVSGDAVLDASRLPSR